MNRAIAIIAFLCLLAGCGLGDRNSAETRPAVAYANEPAGDIDWSYSRRGAPAGPDASELEADLHGLYVVAPDRALVRVTVRADGEQRAQTSRQIRAAADGLARGLDDGQGCRAEVIDFGALERTGEGWSGAATVRFDVAFAGLSTAAERFERLETCMRRFGGVDGSLGDVRIAVSDPRITVDQPNAHRAQLLQREIDARRELAGLAEVAGAPAARPCTSTGDVSIQRRSLRGVALQLDLECRVAPVVAPTPS